MERETDLKIYIFSCVVCLVFNSKFTLLVQVLITTVLYLNFFITHKAKKIHGTQIKAILAININSIAWFPKNKKKDNILSLKVFTKIGS